MITQLYKIAIDRIIVVNKLMRKVSPFAIRRVEAFEFDPLSTVLMKNCPVSTDQVKEGWNYKK